MYTRLALCQREDQNSLLVAKAPAFSTAINPGSEVIVKNPSYEKKISLRCKVVNIMDCELDSDEFKFVLALISNTLTAENLYEVVYVVHYEEVVESESSE